MLQKSDKEVCLLTTYHLAINAMLVVKCGAPTPDIPVPATICARFFLVRTADSPFRWRITSAEAEVKVGLSGVMCKRVVGVTLLFEFKPGDAPTPMVDTVYFEAHAYGDEDSDENEVVREEELSMILAEVNAMKSASASLVATVETQLEKPINLKSRVALVGLVRALSARSFCHVCRQKIVLFFAEKRSTAVYAIRFATTLMASTELRMGLLQA